MQVGDYIEILYMEGEPQYTGKRGTVLYIDSIGQAHGTWGGCALMPSTDKYRIINEEGKQ